MNKKLQQTIKDKTAEEINQSIFMLDNSQDVLIKVRDEGKFEPLPTKEEIQQAINDLEKIRMTLYHTHTRVKKGV